jgi:methylenetetrahydrofolate dehydrogenase (NADP+)/methenyltetrahydrofolate cyclohydrolase
MTIIDGKKIAAEILECLKAEPKPKKFLAAVLAGESPASISFLNQKEKTARELGVDFRLYKFSADLSKDQLREEVGKIVADENCGGVIVQLPLPNRADERDVLDAIPSEKDVDVLGARAVGAFHENRNPVLPPSVGVAQEILSALRSPLSASTVAVVGAGALVGKPVAAWLSGKAKEVIVLDAGDDLALLKRADLVVSGAGVAGLIKPEMLKPGALVIDFGYSRANGKISGDFDVSSLQPPTSDLSYTPTPGGTGPILVAKLFENFYKLNEPQK